MFYVAITTTENEALDIVRRAVKADATIEPTGFACLSRRPAPSIWRLVSRAPSDTKVRQSSAATLRTKPAEQR